MVDTAVSDSYITTLELAETYFANDPRTEAIAWLLLTDAQKTWYLQRATKAIDALPLRGRKYARDGTQDRQFPREYITDWGWYPDCSEEGVIQVPPDVLTACYEESLAIYDSLNRTESSERLKRQREGIISIAYGDSSESYDSSKGKRFMGLISSEAYNLLSKFIARSIPIT